jgi:prepilin-type N-terminal cleavage/methylation domain-containing protein
VVKNIIKFKHSGFTLIEVIVALAIFMIVVAIFASVSYSGLKISVTSKKTLKSVVIAENYIEDIRLARETNPSMLKSKDGLRNWLNNSKAWLSSDENLVDFQDDPGDNKVLTRNSDGTKGVVYTTKVRYTVVDAATDPYLYQFTIEVSQPNTSTYILSTRLFVK